MLIGGLMIIVGAIMHFGGKFLPFGNLPGDIKIQKENFSFYFPVASCIIISVVLSLLLNFFGRK